MISRTVSIVTLICSCIVAEAADIVLPLTGWDFWLSLLLPAVAIIVFWIYKSADPGKIILKIKIVDAKSGKNPSKGQCIGRYLGYYLSMLPMFVGFIAIASDKRKQGWHDKLAGTLVVKVSKSEVDNTP